MTDELKPIPFFIKEREPAGSWNTEELRLECCSKSKNPEEARKQYARLKNAWWYDFILVLTDKEYEILRKEFVKLDTDKSNNISLKELKKIGVDRKRLLNKEAMHVVQPEMDKFMARLEKIPVNDDKYNQETIETTGIRKDSALSMNEKTCRDLIAAFSFDDRKEDLSFYEYLGMMQYVQLSINLFQLYDLDGNGDLDPDELNLVLQFFGYYFDRGDVELMRKKLGVKLLHTVNRTEFVSICAKLAAARTTYIETKLNGSKFLFDGLKFSTYFSKTILPNL